MDVVFDAMGTLFDTAALRERLGSAVFEAWFERTLHSAAVLTILGDFVPFAELARATLVATAASLELEIDGEDVVAGLRRLPPVPDAREALELVRKRGGRAFVLTNGGREAGEELVERAGFTELVERIFGVDEVEAYKPDPRPYRLVLGALGSEATLVATHAWDVAGAAGAGLQAVWVNQIEQPWPFPGKLAQPATAGGLVEAARLATG